MENAVVITTNEILDSIKQTIRLEFAEARSQQQRAPGADTKTKSLTFSEVCRRLRVSPPTLRARLKRGEIKAFRVGSNWRITEEALAAYQNGKGDA